MNVWEEQRKTIQLIGMHLRENIFRRMPDLEQELLILSIHKSSPAVFSGVCVDWSLVVSIMVCRVLFVSLSFYFWPLNYLSCFYLPLLNTHLLSSNFSYLKFFYKNIWITIVRTSYRNYNFNINPEWNEYCNKLNRYIAQIARCKENSKLSKRSHENIETKLQMC